MRKIKIVVLLLFIMFVFKAQSQESVVITKDGQSLVRNLPGGVVSHVLHYGDAIYVKEGVITYKGINYLSIVDDGENIGYIMESCRLINGKKSIFDTIINFDGMYQGVHVENISYIDINGKMSIQVYFDGVMCTEDFRVTNVKK